MTAKLEHLPLPTGRNRTKVGLKAVTLDSLRVHPHGRNRTKVGLKVGQEWLGWLNYFVPQSNQGGIESLRSHCWPPVTYWAAIEPRWD